jgi:hypothetical protein
MRNAEISTPGQTICTARSAWSERCLHRTRPTGRLTPYTPTDLGRNGHRRFLVQSLFRQSHREDSVDGPAAEIFRIREQVPVGIHRLGDGGITEPGLDHLGIQVGSDQRRGVEVAQLEGELEGRRPVV